MEPLEEIRRIVTGHDKTGNAVVLIDAVNSNKFVQPVTGVANRLFWMTNSMPADGAKEDRAAEQGGVVPTRHGTVFRIVDFPSMTDDEIAAFPNNLVATQFGNEPGHLKYRDPSHPLMHRTRTVDYAIVLFGEIEMKLDDDEPVRLKAGDVIIQQGTNHAWINRSGRPCRIAFVLIDANDPFG